MLRLSRTTAHVCTISSKGKAVVHFEPVMNSSYKLAAPPPQFSFARSFIKPVVPDWKFDGAGFP